MDGDTHGGPADTHGSAHSAPGHRMTPHATARRRTRNNSGTTAEQRRAAGGGNP
ncbi:hypothetical protein [Streptomyces sp. 8L]|uniref:hypothetical protein n=1 Tax=Streptomyces sp. 8L TaxID=2877242 RepID=UPI001CD2A372|nr:hypothetical protein [Streptomyces sp. 8L]MCA1220320.1 hypothetical protein [Streptomyces sp. 8L]